MTNVVQNGLEWGLPGKLDSIRSAWRNQDSSAIEEMESFVEYASRVLDSLRNHTFTSLRYDRTELIRLLIRYYEVCEWNEDEREQDDELDRLDEVIELMIESYEGRSVKVRTFNMEVLHFLPCYRENHDKVTYSEGGSGSMVEFFEENGIDINKFE